MRKVTFAILLIFLFSACNNINHSNPNSISPENEVRVSAEHLESVEDELSSEYSADLNEEEKDNSKLSIYWVNDDTAYGVDVNNNDLKIFAVDVKNAEVTRLHTSLPDKEVRGIRRIEDKLLISTTSGFYTVDLSGNIEEIFVFDKEKEKYDLPTDKELLAYYPVISDNLRYISYFILRTDETDGESIPGGKWEIILLDLRSESKTSLLSGVWVPKPSNEEVIEKCPVSFSSDSRYLYYDNSLLYINPLDYFGGRIMLERVR